MMIDDDPCPRSSKVTRHALTVALVKPGRGSRAYQEKNSLSAMLYTRFVIGELTESSTRAFKRCHSAALPITANSFMLHLLMGNIGSHDDPTSGAGPRRVRWQATDGGPRSDQAPRGRIIGRKPSPSPSVVVSYPLIGAVVSLHDGLAKEAAKPSSARQRVNRKIAHFSVWAGGLAVLFVALAWVVASYSSLERSKRINLSALSEIQCSDATCDTSALITDPHSVEPDYLESLPHGM